MASFEVPLDIPNVEIEKAEINKKGELIISVQSTSECTRCEKCGQQIMKLHGCDHPVFLRHLPVLGRVTYIRIRPKRYQCLTCKKNQRQPKSYHGIILEVLIQ